MVKKTKKKTAGAKGAKKTIKIEKLSENPNETAGAEGVIFPKNWGKLKGVDPDYDDSKDVKKATEYAPTKPLNFLPRAGFKNYAKELKERLLDAEEESREIYYILPIKLPKRLYKALAEACMQMDDPHWTEQDMILKILEDALDFQKD